MNSVKLVSSDENAASDKENDLEIRMARIHAVSAMLRSARRDTLELGLKFEAYLIDMAVLAMSDHEK